jgi:hypothetical protein
MTRAAAQQVVALRLEWRSGSVMPASVNRQVMDDGLATDRRSARL